MLISSFQRQSAVNVCMYVYSINFQEKSAVLNPYEV